MKHRPYKDGDIVWYSPEINELAVSRWDDGEVFCNPEVGFFKMMYFYHRPNSPFLDVYMFYMVCYL